MSRLNLRISVLVLLVLALAVFRAVNHAQGLIQILPMLSPMGAIAVFSGAMLRPSWKGYALTLAALFVSDVLMSRLYYAEYSDGFLYKGWYVTYALFAVQVAVGQALRKGPLYNTAISGALASGLIFWVLSNLAMWAGGGINVVTGRPFDLTLSSLGTCYTLALPFLTYTLAGNLLYAGLLFGGYYALSKRLNFSLATA